MDVIRVETTVLGDFRAARIDHANPGDPDDIGRARVLGWILEHVGEGITIKEAGNSGISGKVLECVDSLQRLVATVVLEPDQNTVVGNVEGKVRSDRSGNNGRVVERNALGAVDRRLPMFGADDDESPFRNAAVLYRVHHLAN